MHTQDRKRTILYWLKLTVTISAAIGVLSGCSMLSGLFEQAPLEDGLYLSYSTGESSWLTVEFKKISNNKYYASTKYEYEDDEREMHTSYGKKEIVDKRLNKENNAVYEAGDLGPLWTAPSSIKAGGTIHGTYIDKITKWNGWEVAVIKAGFGRGSITGVWYYDKTTGFLVGGSIKTAMDIGDGAHYELVETNLDSLMK